MPARFPDKTFLTNPEAAEPQPQPDAAPSCRLLVRKPGGRNVWSLGSRYVLKDRGYYPGSEVEISNTNLAAVEIEDVVAKILTSWTEGNRFFTIHERIEGEPLEDALPKLTREDLARIGGQVGQYMIRLRNITARHMNMIDGRPVVDRRLFKPLPASSTATYSFCTSDEEVAANLALAIAHLVDQKTLYALMARMPSAEPFTFSHSDLHESNILVRDGNLVGLVGWELAGFYPRWWEFVNSCALLSDYLPAQVQDQEALDWFRVYHAVRELPSEESAKIVSDYLNR
ncbi:kinase-like protein [Hypoxylon sp. FL0543]|nr:kinase-like protein [Hypoxylon sp. FL0543]